MAKGNMLLGYSRGSVGDVVMSRVKGQQVSKARNRKPANPKSKRQMAQRSSFINPVKFYTHGVQALFKFAFSDKKVTESDFNAFMRNNSKVSFPVTKAEYDNPGFPALGNYMMTKGKLAEIPTNHVASKPNANWVHLEVTEAPVTTGQLSTAFVENGIAEVGDIITIVAIDLDVVSMSDTDMTVMQGESPKWTIMQFVIDPSNDTPYMEVLPNLYSRGGEGWVEIEVQGANDDPDTHLHAVTFIRSKETALGLEVSTSYLHNGGYIDQYIAHRNTKAEVAKVLADWGATDEAILQGSIAKK